MAIAGCGGGSDGPDRKADDDGKSVVTAFTKTLLTCDADKWKSPAPLVLRARAVTR